MIKFVEILIHLSRNCLQINFLSCYVYDIFHTVQLHSNHGNRYSLAIFNVFEQKMELRRHCCLDLASTRARRRLGWLQYQICPFGVPAASDAEIIAIPYITTNVRVLRKNLGAS